MWIEIVDRQNTILILISFRLSIIDLEISCVLRIETLFQSKFQKPSMFRLFENVFTIRATWIEWNRSHFDMKHVEEEKTIELTLSSHWTLWKFDSICLSRIYRMRPLFFFQRYSRFISVCFIRQHRACLLNLNFDLVWSYGHRKWTEARSYWKMRGKTIKLFN